MVFIPALNTVRVVMVYDMNGVSAINRLHVEKLGSRPDLDDFQQIHQEAILPYWTALRNQTSNQVYLRWVEYTGLTLESDWQSTWQVQTTGAVTGQAMSNNNALVTSWSGNVSGRSTRGRSYLPVVNETTGNGNFVTTVTANALVTAGLDLLTNLIADGFRLVVASYVSNKLPRLSALLTPVTSVTTNTRIDSQRRRLPSMWS